MNVRCNLHFLHLFVLHNELCNRNGIQKYRWEGNETVNIQTTLHSEGCCYNIQQHGKED